MENDRYKFVDTFKNRLKMAMDERELSAAELSKRSGLSESLISGYRTGRQEPKREKIAFLSKALGVDPTWLMGFDVPMNGVQYTEQDVIEHMKGRLGALGSNNEEELIAAMKNDTNFWEHVKILFGLQFTYKIECFKFIDYQKDQEGQNSGETSAGSKGA